MKKIALLLFSLSVLSCSSDDDSAVADNDVSMGDYLPLSNNNYWLYDVQGTMPSASDSIYISGDVTINGNTYKKFQMDELPFGFLSGALNNNGIRKSGDRLLLSGTAMVNFIPDFPMSLQLHDFTVLNESAGNGEIIGTTSGSVPYQYGEYTFDFNYTLTSMGMTHLETYTAPNGAVYNDVIPVMLKLNVAVSTVVTVGATSFPVIIMQPQDVVVSTRYYAKDVGIVHSTTDINYTLATSGFNISLPIPSTMAAEQDEVLIDFQVE